MLMKLTLALTKTKTGKKPKSSFYSCYFQQIAKKIYSFRIFKMFLFATMSSIEPSIRKFLQISQPEFCRDQSFKLI